MPFSDFLDAIWADIWADCPPLGDHHQYHEIVRKLFIEGLPAHEITYKDSKGKTQRLAESPDKTGKAMTVEEGRALHEKMRAMKEAARLASRPSD